MSVRNASHLHGAEESDAAWGECRWPPISVAVLLQDALGQLGAEITGVLLFVPAALSPALPRRGGKHCARLPIRRHDLRRHRREPTLLGLDGVCGDGQGKGR